MRRAPTLGTLVLPAAFILVGCASGDADDSPPSESVTPAPSVSAQPTVDPNPPVATAGGDDGEGLPALEVGEGDAVVYLVTAPNDNDAALHPLTFYVDEAGCLRANVDDRGEAMFVALGPEYRANSTGIVDPGGQLVVGYGEATNAVQRGVGAVPGNFSDLCGAATPAEVFGAVDIGTGVG